MDEAVTPGKIPNTHLEYTPQHRIPHSHVCGTSVPICGVTYAILVKQQQWLWTQKEKEISEFWMLNLASMGSVKVAMETLILTPTTWQWKVVFMKTFHAPVFGKVPNMGPISHKSLIHRIPLLPISSGFTALMDPVNTHIDTHPAAEQSGTWQPKFILGAIRLRPKQ